MTFQDGVLRGEVGPSVQRIEVIRTDLARRGDGVMGDPVRAVVQFWSPEGELLAEHDPFVKVEWAAHVIRATSDPPADQTLEFYTGWFAARDAAYEALTGWKFGNEAG